MSPRRAISIESHAAAPRFRVADGVPLNNFCLLSLGVLAGWNAGKFSGDGEARLILNLIGLQFGEKPLAEIAISTMDLAALAGLSPATVQTAITELATRCGNADPEWVKDRGKCKSGACVCPKLLTVGKRANVNTYRVNLAAFPAAPRYIAPRPVEVPAPEPAPGALVGQSSTVAPGKRWRVPGALLADMQELEVENAAKLPIAVIVTRTGHRCVARIDWLADAPAFPSRKSENHTSPQGTGTISTPRQSERNPLSPLECMSNQDTSTYPIEAGRVTYFTSEITALLDREWHQAPDAGFLPRVLAAAGPELPAPEFAEYARRDLALKKNRKGTSTTHAPQILIAYAKQARAKWDADAAQRAVAEATRAARATELAEWKRIVCPVCLGDGCKPHAEAGPGGVPPDCPACHGTGRAGGAA